ncbi:hypothetical protein [Paraglaciecola sp. L3A3]|uniref:hypothetical protein n=1 Tax=Paraglaciecola sp. L3A3 TaxID=2686358 RepID=UPI00131B76DF|nr:hypothetical protein [Paraglaciecola sp. L3A3]
MGNKLNQSNFCIVTDSDELNEGLFGQVFLFIFEILPYLYEANLKPNWNIKAKHYGTKQDNLVIPGVLDLAYKPQPSNKNTPLSKLRKKHCYALGNDWYKLNQIWNSYFVIPARIKEQADKLGSFKNVLGIHYRGTDKLTAAWDTNAVSYSDYLAIIRDFHSKRPELTRIFLATDDNQFLPFLRKHVSLEIINLGNVHFHKDMEVKHHEKAERALLDCLLLSRCGAVLKNSSALSGFSKILNPNLEIYRCAASKLFRDIPYFPVAYIPPYKTDNQEVQAIINKLMSDDWAESSSPAETLFAYSPRQKNKTIKQQFLEPIKKLLFLKQ